MTNDIVITEHICLRYIERFNPNLNAIEDYKVRLSHAEQGIKAVLEDARYYSDDEKGVIVYSEVYNCCMVIKEKKLITIYQPNYKIMLRERKSIKVKR